MTSNFAEGFLNAVEKLFLDKNTKFATKPLAVAAKFSTINYQKDTFDQILCNVQEIILPEDRSWHIQINIAYQNM